jgi:polysaccharide biosynthesis transport protein
VGARKLLGEIRNMNSVEKEQSTTSSIVTILFRRGWYIVVCLVAVLIPISIYNHTATPTYEAVSTIIYAEPRMQVGPGINYDYQTNEAVVNQIQEIKSRSVAAEVVEALPANVLEKIPLPEQTPENFNKKAYYTAVVRTNTSAAPVAESDVIKIRAQAQTGYTAMSIANTICEVLQQRNQRIRTEEVSGTRAFIEEQLVTQRKRLDDAEKALRKYKVQNKVTNLEGETEEVLSRMTQIEVAYQEAKGEREKAEEALRSINDKIAETQTTFVPSITNVSTRVVEQLKDQLAKTQEKYTGYQLQGVPESNSAMAKLRDDMAKLRSSLVEEARKIVEAENMIDPLSQMASFFEQKVDMELKVQTLKSQEKSLASATSQYDNNLRRLPTKEYELARLTREKELASNLYIMLSERREEARIAEAENVGNLRIIDRASLPKSPISPRKSLNLIIGFVLGLTIGFGLAFFLESLDTSIKTPEEIEKRTGMTIIGSIPRIRKEGGADQKEQTPPKLGKPADILVTYRNPSSPASEAYRTLRTNLQFSDALENARSIILTSSGPREGKSTTVANLAIATAQMGLRTLIIDADLRRPTIHHLFSMHREPGLADILLHFYNSSESIVHHSQQKVKVSKSENSDSANEPDDRFSSAREGAAKTIQKMASLDIAISEAVQPSIIEKLDVLTCGALPENPSELLANETMKDLLALVKEKYEFVVIDAPPVIAVTDAAVLAPHVEGLALVVESGRNDLEIIMKAKGLIERIGVNIIGSILNNVHEKNLYGDYNYYYTYYTKKKSGTDKR